MRKTRDVSWRQLCAIATAQLHAAGPFPVLQPTGRVDWCEWAERIKCRLVRLRLNYPDPPHQLTKAMEAAHRAWQKHADAPDPPPPRRPPRELPNADPPWPRTLSHTGTWTSVSELTGVRPRSGT
jgi:hypothetical protein